MATIQRPLSGWWRRVGASVIDALIITAAGTAIRLAYGFDFGEYFADDAPLLIAARMIDVTYLLVDAALAVVYFVPLMRAWDGQTVGKRALGIRVVRADGRPMDTGTVLLRQVVVQYLFMALLPLLSLINYLLPLRDRENRAGHDFVARTRVVRTSAASIATAAPDATAS